MTTFKELGLSPDIQQALDELGFDEPTPIQEQAIPELLGGHDVIGQAQTGTGKTAAFGLPLLQYLDPANEEVQAIVMTPTRELCIQVTQALRAYAEHLDIEIVAVFGGAPIRSQQSQLRSGAHARVEGAFERAGLRVERLEEIGTEFREYDEERTQPVSESLLRLARLRRRRQEVIRRFGKDKYDLWEASLHWLAYLLLGKLEPVAYVLRLS